ncbi:hypothetical protein [Streptomyces herbicida]|uniref:hypothetical protein n=1 Tax=Streptomyces herbicida TaxID=3065675 RepID=UPI002930FFE0|nr:hypothetical protein [Streptomyces sp. NEAU-HV9]
MTTHNDSTPAPAEDSEPTRVLSSGDEHAPTVHLPATGDATPADEPGPGDAEYSATVLGSHWIQRPEPDDTKTLVENTDTLVESSATKIAPTTPTSPDRVEGTVLRFGPGVTAAVAHRTHRTLPAVPQAPAPRRRRLRRHALPALVLICVIAFLLWQRLGPSVGVRTVAVTARPTAVGCHDTADIVGLVTTNGRPGKLSYRWIRSDGTTSGVLRETVVRGQKHARLHLLWTFQGKGHFQAQAELRILSPTHRTVATHLTYDCP